MKQSSSVAANTVQQTVTSVAVVGLLTYGVYKLVLQPMTLKFGALSEFNQQAGSKLSAWNPQFWRTGGAGTLLITSKAVDEFAKIIYNYSGFLFDNYSSVIGVFKKLSTQSQVSYLAYYFNLKYKLDLYQYLKDGDKGGFFEGGSLPWDGLSDAHLTEINNYVQKLPKYKK